MINCHFSHGGLHILLFTGKRLVESSRNQKVLGRSIDKSLPLESEQCYLTPQHCIDCIRIVHRFEDSCPRNIYHTHCTKNPKEYQIRHQNTKVFKYPCIQVSKYESIKCMQAFKFAILEFDQLLTNNVKARDPVGSKNIFYKAVCSKAFIYLPISVRVTFNLDSNVIYNIYACKL